MAHDSLDIRSFVKEWIEQRQPNMPETVQEVLHDLAEDAHRAGYRKKEEFEKAYWQVGNDVRKGESMRPSEFLRNVFDRL